MDAELEAVLETLEALGFNEVHKASESLRDNDSIAGDSFCEPAPGAPSFTPPQLTQGAEDFERRDELGQGGMAIVYSAEQRSLRREVALKQARQGLETASTSLLREAIITGQLEHPNIVPVHAIIEGDDGPAVVMKRVVGKAWSELLEETPDALDRHLVILEQVCNAIAFAHSRGIMHLDIKPENVMIGDFGEVYVMDWGIARRTVDPDNKHIFGTPSYMPPEMARGQFSPASDVFQLGAVLYEILAGRPLYEGDLITAVRLAYQCPEMTPIEGAPRELMAICEHACRRHEYERHASVAAFREQIAAYREHRAAAQLAETGRDALFRLEALIDGEGGAGSYAAAQAEFSEARFAFEQSLRAWPEGRAARGGLRTTLCRMVEYELRLGHAETAASLLEAVDTPPSALRASVEAALVAEDEERVRISQLTRDADANVGADDRLRAFRRLAVAVLVMTIVLAVSRLTRPDYTPSTLRLTFVGALVLGIASSVVAWWWRTGLNRVNRRLAQLLIATLVVSLLNRAAGAAMDLPAPPVLVADALVVALGGMAIWQLHRLGGLLTAVGFVIAAVGVFEPAWVDDLFVAASVALPVAVLLVRGGQPADPTESEP